MARIHTHSFHGNMVLFLALLTSNTVTRFATAGPCPYLSGFRSTMPITNTFLPGRMPPLMCPQNGTICKGGGKKQEVYRLFQQGRAKPLALKTWPIRKQEKRIGKEEDKDRDTEH